MGPRPGHAPRGPAPFIRREGEYVAAVRFHGPVPQPPPRPRRRRPRPRRLPRGLRQPPLRRGRPLRRPPRRRVLHLLHRPPRPPGGLAVRLPARTRHLRRRLDPAPVRLEPGRGLGPRAALPPRPLVPVLLGQQRPQREPPHGRPQVRHRRPPGPVPNPRPDVHRRRRGRQNRQPLGHRRHPPGPARQPLLRLERLGGPPRRPAPVHRPHVRPGHRQLRPRPPVPQQLLRVGTRRRDPPPARPARGARLPPPPRPRLPASTPAPAAGSPPTSSACSAWTSTPTR